MFFIGRADAVMEPTGVYMGILYEYDQEYQSDFHRFYLEHVNRRVILSKRKASERNTSRIVGGIKLFFQISLDTGRNTCDCSIVLVKIFHSGANSFFGGAANSHA